VIETPVDAALYLVLSEGIPTSEAARMFGVSVEAVEAACGARTGHALVPVGEAGWICRVCGWVDAGTPATKEGNRA
jgi:hypothetical protein